MKVSVKGEFVGALGEGKLSMRLVPSTADVGTTVWRCVVADTGLRAVRLSVRCVREFERVTMTGRAEPWTAVEALVKKVEPTEKAGDGGAWSEKLKPDMSDAGDIDGTSERGLPSGPLT